MNKGFTLIELLVVVAIIGIISAIGVLAFNGYIERTNLTKCREHHNFFKKEILRKWMNAELKNSNDIEIQPNGLCFLHWLPSNAELMDTGTDIIANMKANRSLPSLCNQYYQGSESLIFDHFYGLGYRNPLLGKHGVWGDKPAIDTPGRGNILREGGSVFRCGANAGLSDEYSCKLITMCELNNQIETMLVKEK